MRLGDLNLGSTIRYGSGVNYSSCCKSGKKLESKSWTGGFVGHIFVGGPFGICFAERAKSMDCTTKPAVHPHRVTREKLDRFVQSGAIDQTRMPMNLLTT